MTKPTPGAMRAVDRIIQQIFRWCYTEIEKKRDPALLKKLLNTLGDKFAAIIDSETAAERDRLRESNSELREGLNEVRNVRVRYGGILTVEAGKSAVMECARIANNALARSEPESGERPTK